MASNILGKINGETDTIMIRLYNASPEQIKEIEDNYDVESINKIT